MITISHKDPIAVTAACEFLKGSLTGSVIVVDPEDSVAERIMVGDEFDTLHIERTSDTSLAVDFQPEPTRPSAVIVIAKIIDAMRWAGFEANIITPSKD